MLGMLPAPHRLLAAHSPEDNFGSSVITLLAEDVHVALLALEVVLHGCATH